MDHFTYQGGTLHAEGVTAESIAQRFGTPTYVYSEQTFTDHLDRLEAAFRALDPLICYSVKSCSNLEVCRALVQRGAGLDAVSGGEVERAWLAGCPMERVAFAGVGKTDAELRAALDGRHSPLADRPDLTGGRSPVGRGPVGCFNVESEPEFEALAAQAKHLGVRPHAALRVNPDVDARTHAYTTTGKKENKFGVDIDRAVRFFERYGNDASVRLDAVHLHIGSPVYETGPYVEAITRALRLIDDLAERGCAVRTLDLGGGFGADYESHRSPAASVYAEAIVPLLRDRVASGLRVMLEPGRTISANAGILLTRVLYVKEGGAGRRFVICDAGMHTLIRPALYGAFHFVWPVTPGEGMVPSRRAERVDLSGLLTCDVVGPICESSDFLARERPLPPVRRGDLLAVFTAGAYGMVMASNYNTHALPAEVLVSGTTARLVRRRQDLADLLLPELQPEPRPGGVT